MNKLPKELADEINGLVSQLVSIAQNQPVQIKKTAKSTNNKKGASAALEILIEEKFFDAPKELTTIMEKMKEMGRYYPNTTVSMNLLNLVRRRILVRFKEKESKSWKYAIHK